MDLATRRVYITSHNHGFAVRPPGSEPASPPGANQGQDHDQPFETPFGRAVVSHLNLNDGVVEGVRLIDAPAFGVQYHPEAAPGPHDADDLFGEFCTLMAAAR